MSISILFFGHFHYYSSFILSNIMSLNMSLFCGTDFPVEITKAPIPLTHSVSLLLHRLSPIKMACPDCRHANNIYRPASIWRYLNNRLIRYIFFFPRQGRDSGRVGNAAGEWRVSGGNSRLPDCVYASHGRSSSRGSWPPPPARILTSFNTVKPSIIPPPTT